MNKIFTNLMTTARTLLTAVLIVIGFSYSQKAWADTSVISNGVGGWTKITSLPATLSDYYFVFVDDSKDLMLSFEEGENHSNGLTAAGTPYKTMLYRTSQDPAKNPAMLWEISTNSTGWSIKSAVEPTYYLQTEWDAFYYCRTHDNGGGDASWYRWTIAYADSKWTIQNGKNPASGYVGPWNEAAFSNGQRVAANKTGDNNIGHFQIYSILKSAVDLTGTGFSTIRSSTPFNYTHNIVNPNAVYGTTGWTGTDTQARNGNNGFDGVPGFFEFCDWGADSWSGSLSQEISGLPAGRYRVRVASQQSDNHTTLTLDLNGTSVNLPANGTSNGTILQTGVETTAGNGVAGWRYTYVDKLITAGTATITMSSTGSAVNRWANTDNVELYLLSPQATVTTFGSALAAGQWYAFSIDATAEYSISSSASATIYYTQTGTDGCPDLSTVTSQNVNTSTSIGPLALLDGTTLYVYSSANVTLTSSSLPTTTATASDMSNLSSAIESHHLGFDDGEYAPYNNVAGVAILQEALSVDTSNPANYTHAYIAGLVSAINDATWTANDGEVNAIYNGDFAIAAHDGATNSQPTGWAKTQGTYTGDGYNVRYQSGNAGLAATSAGKCMMTKFNATYGWQTGYTMPLNAETNYILTFKVGGWNEPKTDTWVVLIAPDGTETTIWNHFDVPQNGNAHTDSTLSNEGSAESNGWLTVARGFTTSVAGDYKIKVVATTGGDQNQRSWSDFKLFTASASTLPDFTDITDGQHLNATVDSEYDAAFTAYMTTGKTWERYKTLVTKTSVAAASIAVYEQILALTGKLNTANQRGGIPEANITSSAVVTNYTNGVYETLDDVISTWKTFVSEYWNTNAVADADMTAFIVNNSFEFGDATEWGGDPAVGGADTNKNAEKFNTKFDVYQKLTGLPAGSYELKVQGFYRPGANNNTSSDQHASLYAKTPYEGDNHSDDSRIFFSQGLKLIASEGKNARDNTNGFTTANTNSGSTKYVPNSQGDGSKAFAANYYDQTLKFAVGNTGEIVLGVQKTTTIANDWTLVDNFRLIYKGSGVVGLEAAPAKVVATDRFDNKAMNVNVYNAQEAAYAAWASSETAANYIDVRKSHDDAAVSKAAYEAGLAALDEVSAYVEATNVYTNEAYLTINNLYTDYLTLYTNRSMTDVVANALKVTFFGKKEHRAGNSPLAELLASAWDCNGAYDWTNYYVNTWSTEGDADGAGYYPVPFLEYYADAGNSLDGKTMMATVPVVPGLTYGVTANVRVAVINGSAPTGIKMQVATDTTGDDVLDTTTDCAKISWTDTGITLSGNADYKLYKAIVTITGAAADYDANGDGYSSLNIRMVVDGTNNVSWVTFKEVKYTCNLSAATIETLKNNLNTLIASDKEVPLGFIKDEFAPYNNVEQLEALAEAEALAIRLNNAWAIYNASGKTPSDLNTLVGAFSYVNTLHAYENLLEKTGKLVSSTPTRDDTKWNKNAEEVNCIYWSSNYTADDIEVIDGRKLIVPLGWDLAGYPNAYATRLIKTDVNAGTIDVGLVAVPDSTCLFTKFDTNYGGITGYTLPLKPSTTYALTFLYTSWENPEGDVDKQVDITIKNNASGGSVTPSVTYYRTVKDEKGNFYPECWKLYMATFTTQADYGSDGKNDNYVITFTKNRAYSNAGTGSQLQVAMGDIYLLRYLNETLTVNGLVEAATANIGDNGLSYTTGEAPPAIVMTNIAIKRTLNSGAWNSLVLPFNMTQSQATEAFHLGGDTRICYYVGATFDNDEYMACRLRFKSRPCGIMANVPIIIWGDATNATKYNGSDAAHTLKQNLVVLKMPSAIWNGTAQPQVVDGRPGAAQGYDDVVEGDKTPIYNYVGTYKTVYIPKHGVYFTNSTDNTYKKSTAGTTRLRPTRAYFKDMTVDEYGESHVKLANFSVDDIETGIMAIEEDGSLNVVTGSNIYSLDGKLVRRNATTLDGLRNGLYIMNGKKYLVK